MQSWFTFELDGRNCRVEKRDIHETLANFLVHLDPRFSGFSSKSLWGSNRLVILGDIEGDRHRFRVVDAGLVLLPTVAGRQIWTADGIRHMEPDHPVNLALEGQPVECGQDRKDTLLTLMFEGYYRPDLRRQGQMSDQFDAIVSRTANVPAIREIASQVFASTEQLRHEAAQKAEKLGDEATVWTGRKDIFGDRFTKGLFKVKYRPVVSYCDDYKRRFHQPDNLIELLRLRREYTDAVVFSGGTGLAQLASHVEWNHLISLEGVKEMNTIITTEEDWEIGAAVSLTQISEHIGRECQPFVKMLRRFASRPLRNRSTLGGLLAKPNPKCQITPLLMALNARIILLSTDGSERDAPISKYFDGQGGTIMGPGELIRSVILPRTGESQLAARGANALLTDIYTVGPRRSLCDPYLTAAYAIQLRNHTVTKARIAYSGVGPSPIRALEAEQYLAGRKWNEESLVGCLRILNDQLEVRDLPGAGDASYRKQLVVTLFQKFYHQHPDQNSVLPRVLTATQEFAKLDQPFFDLVSF